MPKGLCRPIIKWPRATPQVSYYPSQLAGSYNFPKVASVKPVKIGIVSLGGSFTAADLNGALAAQNLPAPVVTVLPVDGASLQPDPGGADGENALDLQVIAAAWSYCTGLPADIVFATAPNTDTGYADAYRALQQAGCSVVSTSWGQNERGWGSTLTAMESVLEAVAGAGVTLTAASGDNGSSDGGAGSNADYPASSPVVVGCGGTTKTGSSETVWGNGPGEGTGGGFSAVFPKQPWQIGAPAGPGRMVPDCAADADPQTGYRILLGGQWQVIGGTSAVAPLMAGLFGVLNGALLAAGKPVIGNPLKWMWANPACFVDVVSGSNGQWRAGVGADPCTGLGTPNGAAMLTALLGAVSPPPPPPPGPPPVPPPPSPPPPVPPTFTEIGTPTFPAVHQGQLLRIGPFRSLANIAPGRQGLYVGPVSAAHQNVSDGESVTEIAE